MGKGRIHIKMFDGCIRTLDDVRYVPQLKSNLLSIRVLDKSSCSIKVLGGEMERCHDHYEGSSPK